MKKGNFYKLKYLALFTMLLDHIAIVFFKEPQNTYYILRGFGRIAFPLFGFLLCVAALNRDERLHQKALRRILLLALISEPLYDIVIFQRMSFETQNICFTLFFGYLYYYLVSVKKVFYYLESSLIPKLGRRMARYYNYSTHIMAFLVFSIICQSGRVSYGAFGFFFVVLLFKALQQTRKSKRMWGIIGAVLMFSLYEILEAQWLAPCVLFSLIPMIVFDERREEVSKVTKFICRYGYPLHLGLLIVVKVLMVVL